MSTNDNSIYKQKKNISKMNENKTPNKKCNWVQENKNVIVRDKTHNSIIIQCINEIDIYNKMIKTITQAVNKD